MFTIRAKNALGQGKFQEALTANQYLMIQAMIFFTRVFVEERPLLQKLMSDVILSVLTRSRYDISIDYFSFDKIEN